MKILILNSRDRGGGAAEIARCIAEGYRLAGHEVRWLVGTKTERDDATAIEVPFGGVARWAAAGAERLGRLCGIALAPRARLRWRRLLQAMHARSLRARWRGEEDFELAGVPRALAALPWQPDLVHAHNLHSFNHHTHFDLRLLPELSRRATTVVTLHDPWLFTGHCAHFVGCDRWRTGCGACPDLGMFPPVRRDRTAFNWRRKAQLFAQSRLHLVGVSEWILRAARESMLANAAASWRVIPNGVDPQRFRPAADRDAVRAELGLPPGAKVLAFASELGARNPFRDFAGMQAAAVAAARRLAPRRLVVVALGAERSGRSFDGSLEVRSPGFVEREAMVRWLQASDVLLHAAIADTSPTIVYEAMACGVPVVATRVGGIPEQIADGVTGLLVPAGAREALAEAAHALLRDESRARALGTAARRRVVAQFTQASMVRRYVETIEAIDAAG